MYYIKTNELIPLCKFSKWSESHFFFAIPTTFVWLVGKDVVYLRH